MIFIHNPYVLWAVSGLLLGAGFYSLSWWPVSLVGGYLFFKQLLNTPQIWKTLFLGALLAWTIKYAIAISYFWSAFPLDFLPLDLGGVTPTLIFLYWFTGSLWLGSGVWVLCIVKLLLEKNYPHGNQFVMISVLSLAWVWSEVCGSFIFSFVTLGQGSDLNTAFSFGYTGYLFTSHTPLLQLSSLVGVYGLSFTFALLSSSGYLLIRINQLKWLLVGFIALLVTAQWSLPYDESTYNNVTFVEVISVDTQFNARSQDSLRRANQRQVLMSAVELALIHEPDYLLLPEDTGLFLGSPRELENIKVSLGTTNTIIVDSRTIRNGTNLNLEAYIYNNQFESVHQIAKRYLVPQGEYMPTVYASLFKLFGQEALVEYVKKQINYTVGDYTSQTDLPDHTPAVLFCFESVDPIGVKRLKREHSQAPFIAHPVSHAWFNQSRVLWDQLDSMLQVQAVWNDTYIISASNLGRSQMYTPQGSVLDMEEIASGENWSLKKARIYLP